MTRLATIAPARLAAALGALLLAALLLAAGARAATVTVAPGDSLSAIAARTGTSVAALARANGIGDPDVIQAGQRLVVPGGGGGGGGGASSGGTYTVRPGDSLSAIAARHGVSVAALASANRIANPDLIAAGRRLVIPSGGAGAGPAIGAASGSYRVRSGDTLGAIAAAHGTTVAALAALNGIRNPAMIAAGRVLSVPAASPGLGAPTDPVQVTSLLAHYAARYGVDPALARAIAWQESRWTQSARSHVGAIGVMQLMPGTARWIGRDVVGRRLNPHVLADNIEGGVAYLAWLRNRTTSTRRTIAAYYQGLASVRRIGLYDDTKAYVRSVVGFMGNV